MKFKFESIPNTPCQPTPNHGDSTSIIETNRVPLEPRETPSPFHGSRLFFELSPQSTVKRKTYNLQRKPLEHGAYARRSISIRDIIERGAQESQENPGRAPLSDAAVAQLYNTYVRAENEPTVCRQQVFRVRHGQVNLDSNGGAPPKLAPASERLIMTGLEAAAKRGDYFTTSQVQNTVQEMILLQDGYGGAHGADDLTPSTGGKHFLKRVKSEIGMVSKVASKQSSVRAEKSTASAFYATCLGYQRMFEEVNIARPDGVPKCYVPDFFVAFGDETSVGADGTGTVRVLAKVGSRPRTLEPPPSSKHVSMLVVFDGSGQVKLIQFIVEASARSTRHLRLQPTTLVMTSENGSQEAGTVEGSGTYTHLLQEIVKLKHKDPTHTAPRFFIVDGSTTHNCLVGDQLMHDNDIMIGKLLPNTSHFTQASDNHHLHADFKNRMRSMFRQDPAKAKNVHDYLDYVESNVYASFTKSDITMALEETGFDFIEGIDGIRYIGINMEYVHRIVDKLVTRGILKNDTVPPSPEPDRNAQGEQDRHQLAVELAERGLIDKSISFIPSQAAVAFAVQAFAPRPPPQKQPRLERRKIGEPLEGARPGIALANSESEMKRAQEKAAQKRVAME